MSDKFFRAETGISIGASGTAAAPVIQANTDTNTGIYFPGDDQFAISIGGTLGFSLDTVRNALFASNVAINGTALTSSQTTFNIMNAGVTSLNIGGAATALVMGAVTGAATIRNPITNIAGLVATGDIAVNGGDITTTSATLNIAIATATTVNAFRAATTINQGSTTVSSTLNFGNLTQGAAGSHIRAGFFHGNGAEVTNVTAKSIDVETDTTTDATFYPVFATATGTPAELKSSAAFYTYNPGRKLFNINGRAEYAGTISVNGSTTAPIVSQVNANSFQHIFNPSANSTSSGTAVAIIGRTAGTSSQATVTGLGVQGYHQGSGNVATLSALRSTLILQDPVPTTITTGIGLCAGSPFHVGAGTITNVYGVFVESQYNATFAPTSWGVYQSGTFDKNYFGGRTLIGTLTDTGVDDLQVGGSARFLGNVVSTADMQAVNFNSTSDARLKENVQTAGGLSVVSQLRGVEFNFTETKKPASGVIAQEIEKVLPHIVTEGSDGFKRVAYDQIIAYLIESINELNAKIVELEISKK